MSYTPRPDVFYQQFVELRDLVRERFTASPLGYTSISEGALRILSEEGLIVEGSARIDGILAGSGDFNWTGDMNLQGSQSVTGPTTFTGQVTVNGPWDLNGNGDITGNVNLTGNFTVLPGGLIQVDGMIIDPADGGSVTFPGGAVVRAGSGGGVEVRQGSYAAVITGSGASVGRSGRSITLSESGIRLEGVAAGSPGNGTQQGVYYEDGLGWLRVSTGA